MSVAGQAWVVLRHVWRDGLSRACWLGALALLLAWAVGSFIWQPVQDDHAALTRALYEAGEQHRQYLREQELQAQLLITDAQLMQMEQRLASQADRVAFMSGLAELTKDSGLSIISQNYDERTLEGGVRQLRLEMSFQGRYAQLRHLLESLPELPGLLRIEDLNIEQAATGGVRGRLRLVSYRDIEVGT